MVRQGIPPPLRCAVWLSNVVLIVHHDLELAKEFRTLSKVRMLDQTYATVLDQQVGWKHLLPPDANVDMQREAAASVPTFGNHDWEHHLLLALDAVTGGRLPMAGQLARTKVLLALERTLGMEYTPLLPTLVSLLLMVMSESYAFYTIREMLHAPGYLTPYYLATNPMEYLAQARTFADVLTKLHPQTAQTMQDIGILPRRLVEDVSSLQPSYDIDDDDHATMGLAPMFQDFFVSLLPIPQVLRIMDIFTLEGIKVLFRVGVALVCLFQRDCASRARQIQTPHEWWDAIHDYTHNPSSLFSFDMLLKKAYGVHGHVVGSGGGGGTGPTPRRGSRRRILRPQPIRFPTRYILARIMKMEEEQIRLALSEGRLKYPATTKQSQGKHQHYSNARPLGLIDHYVEEGTAAAETVPSATTTPSELPLNADESSPLSTDVLYPHRPPSHVDKEIPRPILAQPIHVRTWLAQWLPLSLRFTNLDLIYSTNFHGRSLERFYNHVQGTNKTLLLAQVLLAGSSNNNNKTHTPEASHETTDDQQRHHDGEVVIGMYASQPWKPTTHVYGDGECFLFRLSPDPQVWKWKPRLPAPSRSNDEDDDNQNDVSFFLPTANRRQQTPSSGALHFDNATALREQFMVATSQYISMGANPDGSCGLRFNEDLTKGESSSAAGFDNEPLVPHQEMFEVGLVEVYRLLRQFDGHASA